MNLNGGLMQAENKQVIVGQVFDLNGDGKSLPMI